MFIVSSQAQMSPEVETDVDLVLTTQNPVRSTNKSETLPWYKQIIASMTHKGMYLYGNLSQLGILIDPGNSDFFENNPLFTTIHLPEKLSDLSETQMAELLRQFSTRYQMIGLFDQIPEVALKGEFYFSSIAILSRYSFESQLPRQTVENEINHFLNQLGSHLNFDEKIEFASTLSSFLVTKYDDERAKFKTSGLRNLGDLLSRLAHPDLPTGVCGDIMLATNSFLVALDPSLKSHIFGLSYSLEREQHLLTAVFNPHEKGKEVRFINYDVTSSTSKGDPFLLDVSHDSVYKTYGIQARLYDVEGKELSEIPSDRFQFFAKIIGARSSEILGFSSLSIDSPSMSTSKVRVTWKREAESDLIQKNTQIFAGTGKLSDRSYEAIALQFNKSKKLLGGGESQRNIQVGILGSQDKDQSGVSSNLILSHQKNWKTGNIFQSRKVSLTETVGTSIGATLDLSKGEVRKIGVGADGWVRGYVKSSLSVFLSQNNKLSIDHTEFRGLGLSNINSLYSIRTDFKETLRNLSLVDNGADTRIRFQHFFPKDKKGEVWGNQFSSPYGGVTTVGMSYSGKKEAISLAYQTPSTNRQLTPLSLLQNGLNDQRLILNVQKVIKKKKKTWTFKGGVSLPLDSEKSPTFIQAGVKLQK